MVIIVLNIMLVSCMPIKILDLSFITLKVILYGMPKWVNNICMDKDFIVDIISKEEV